MVKTALHVLLWLVGLAALLTVTGKVPHGYRGWQMMMAGITFWWIIGGGLLALRWLYRFVVR